MSAQWELSCDDWSLEPVPGDWWVALESALEERLMGWRPLGLRCVLGAHGVVRVTDLDEELSFRIQRQDQGWQRRSWQDRAIGTGPVIVNEDVQYSFHNSENLSLPSGIRGVDEGQEAWTGDIEEDATAPVELCWGPQPDIRSATSPSHIAPDALAERLESACGDLANARSETEAAETALAILRRFVDIERGAVLLVSEDSEHYDIAAVRGVPGVDDGRGLAAPRGRGLAPLVARRGFAVQFTGVGGAEGAVPVEVATGDPSHGMMLVPVIDLEQGDLLGLIELSRPTIRLQPWQLEVAIAVGACLGDVLCGLRTARREPGRAWA